MPNITLPSGKTCTSSTTVCWPTRLWRTKTRKQFLAMRPVLGLRRHEWKRNHKVQVLHEAPKNMSQSIMVPDSSPECLICSRPAFEGCTTAPPCTSSSPYMASISGAPTPSSNPAFRITFFADENKEFDLGTNHAPYTTRALKHISPKTPCGWTAIIGFGYLRCPVRL